MGIIRLMVVQCRVYFSSTWFIRTRTPNFIPSQVWNLEWYSATPRTFLVLNCVDLIVLINFIRNSVKLKKVLINPHEYFELYKGLPIS